MMFGTCRTLFTILLLLFPVFCLADTITVSGHLNDAGNTALIGSGLWVGDTPDAALFPDPADPFYDWDIANNVALHSFTVSLAGNVRFQSAGFAAGGADPYFTLFSGSGAGATFQASNYDQAFCLDINLPCGGDFDYTYTLGAGTYTVALGVFGNLSWAENTGAGTLGDGFTFGDPNWVGNYYYELAITTSDAPIPEPSYLSVFALLSALAVWRMRSKRKCQRAI
ncbi:MAG: DVUA0089 family protein [Bryobacterales bacterium]|nr:DVUA0089 family protein [Bryobacterales bacterium]